MEFPRKHNANEFPILPTPSDHAFPVLAIAALSIMGTGLLLLIYYVLVNKCCFALPQTLLRWLSVLRSRRNDHDSFIALSPSMWTRGLDESVIRSIPTFQYSAKEGKERDHVVHGCVVCLNEFQEHDMLRALPSCGHLFHLDCIDIWFQSNDNCPLCRTSISGYNKYPINQIVAPSSSPQRSQHESVMGSDEDFVVIELGDENEEEVAFARRQTEREVPIPTEVHIQVRNVQSSLPARKIGHKREKSNSKPHKRRHGSITGDECIDVRGNKDEEFSIQPLRRSFSWDSAVDKQLYFSVQAIIHQNPFDLAH